MGITIKPSRNLANKDGIAINKGGHAQPGSGRYASSYTDPAIGSVVVGLLEQLLSGEVTPILDVDSYYRNEKRWPIGMQLVNGKLIDAWPPGTTVN
jgi:hypothetical protein